MASPRQWSSLAPGTRRRWVAVFGGQGAPAQRAARAQSHYEAGEHLPAERTGHEPASVRAGREMSAFTGDNAMFKVYSNLSRTEARRLARYDGLVAQLARGRMSGREFDRRVSSWRPFRGEPFASDPRAVLAALDRRRDDELELFEYRSGRAA